MVLPIEMTCKIDFWVGNIGKVQIVGEYVIFTSSISLHEIEKSSYAIDLIRLVTSAVAYDIWKINIKGD